MTLTDNQQEKLLKFAGCEIIGHNVLFSGNTTWRIPEYLQHLGQYKYGHGGLPDLECLDVLVAIIETKCLKYQLEKGDEKYYWAILYIPSKDGFERVLGHEKSLVEAIQKALLNLAENQLLGLTIEQLQAKNRKIMELQNGY